MDITYLYYEDMEGWLDFHVLELCGYHIKRSYGFKNLNHALSTITAEDKNIIVLGHSMQDHNMLVERKRKGRSTFIPVEKLIEKYNLYKVHTCFWDFDTSQPTDYLNLPGFDEKGAPGHYTIDGNHKYLYSMNRFYRDLLGSLKQKCIAAHITDPAKVVEKYLTLVLPKLRRYEKQSGYTWQFQAFQKLKY